MLRLSKVFVRGIPIGLTLVALALDGGITSLQAIPMYTTTIMLPTGRGNVPSSMLDEHGLRGRTRRINAVGIVKVFLSELWIMNRSSMFCDRPVGS